MSATTFPLAAGVKVNHTLLALLPDAHGNGSMGVAGVPVKAVAWVVA